MEKVKRNLLKNYSYRKIIKIVSVVFIVIILLLPIFRSIQDGQAKLSNKPDFSLSAKADPIIIDGNAALNNTASSGNGTVSNPYIIENMVINASGKADNGISIQNTNVYFIIRNCTITDTYPFGGILLRNVTNGKLINNTLNNNCYGIYVIESYNNSIAQNRINSSDPYSSIFGIYLFDSSSNSIANNTAQFYIYGIYLYTSCNNNTLQNNTVSNNGSGIYLQDDSNYNTVQNNTANNNGYGIYLENSDYNRVTGNVFQNNSEDPYFETTNSIGNVIEDNDCTWTRIVINKNADFRLYTRQGDGSAGSPYVLEDFMYNLSGRGVTGILIQNTDAHFILKNCTILNIDFYHQGISIKNATNGLIINNTVAIGDNQGIRIEDSYNINITQNIVNYFLQSGIALSKSHDIRLFNNTVRQGMFGIIVSESHNNTFWYNKVSYTDYYGFDLNAANGNTFINNTVRESFQYGFHLNIACNNTFINNTCIDNWYSGFCFSVLSNNNTLIHNILNSNYQYGIEVHTSESNTISWNIINDNSIEGIRLYKANYNNITWNVLHGNPQAINEISCVGNLIKNNDFGLLPAFLYHIFPNPNVNGFVYLNWSSVVSATRYYIYRSTSVIESVDKLVPIALVSANNYTDRVHVNGTFYYIVIAGHALGNSSISNCENVTILVTPTDDGILFIIIGIIIIGAIAASAISIYTLKRRKKVGSSLSLAKKFKNLSLPEKLQAVITNRIPMENFAQLNDLDLTNLLGSEIGVISAEIKVRMSNLPLTDMEKDEILQELSKLPRVLQIKLLSQLEANVLTEENGPD